MTYKFNEIKYPTRDQNIDLHFDNDVIYSDLTGDTLDKYNTNDVVVPSVKPIKTNEPTNLRKQTKKNNYGIYLMFIFFVILIISVWYIYGMVNRKKVKERIDYYPSKAELTMLSPDIGVGNRFGRI